MPGGVEGVHPCAGSCACVRLRLGVAVCAWTSWACVVVHVYLYMLACVQMQVSEYMCRHVIVSMYVNVGRLCMYLCADF